MIDIIKNHHYLCGNVITIIEKLMIERLKSKPWRRKILRLYIAGLALVVGGGLSLFASGNPDGLEWALFGNAEGGYSTNMGLDEENFGVSSQAADTAENIQEKTSFLPDYSFPGSESAAGTTVSGIVGSALVAGVALRICFAGGFFRKKRQNKA